MGSIPLILIIRGLDPRIHVFATKEDVDGRIKSGHDVSSMWLMKCDRQRSCKQRRKECGLEARGPKCSLPLNIAAMRARALFPRREHCYA